MKWSDLTLKERKQIYDAVRAENPNASYFDIKSQFDLIPEYEDGVSSINLNEQWRKPVGGGMPRWEKANKDFKKLLSGLNKTIGTALTGASLATTGIWNAARLLNIGKGSNWRLAAAKNALTGSKAGLAADIGNFIEEPTVTNGVQVGLSKVSSKDLTTTSNKIINTISTGFDFDDLTKVPTYEDGGKKVTPPKELGLTPGTPEYYKRQQQISGRAELVQPEAYVTPVGYIKDAILPDKKTYELVKGIDTAYGTDYLDAYKRIAARDMTGRGKYIKYAELPGNKNAKISRVRDVQDYGPVVDDYVITIDPLQYLPGTANHELGHLADQLASDANNRYLTYLLDEGNIMGPGELRSKGINVGSDMQSYLLDPSESKSHMLHLKRALVNEGKIHDWSSKVNQNTIEDFLFDPRNTGIVNNANKLQYNMYRNKSRFVDRINNLTPMEFITPLLLPVAGYETNKE